MSKSFDRRSYLRLTMVEVHVQYGPVLNMSDTGLLFCTVDEPKMKVGSRGYIRITHAPSKTSLRVKVKIVWMSPTPHGTRIGADFRGLTMQDQAVIAKLMVDAGDPDDDSFERRKSPRL